MPSMQLVWCAVGLPALMALVVLLLAWNPRRTAPTGGARRTGGWAPGVALGGAWIAGHLALVGWTGFPPASAWHWLLFAAAGAILIGIVAALRPLPRVPRWIFGAMLGLLAFWTMQPVGDVAAPRLWQIGLAAVVLLHWLLLAPLQARVRGGWTPLHLVIVLSSASILLADGAALIRMGMITGGLAAACGSAVLVGLIRREVSLAPAGSAVISLMLPMILLTGYFYMEADPPLPIACFALLAGAPLAAWLGEAPWFSSWRPWQQRALGTALVIACCAAALAIAYGVV